MSFFAFVLTSVLILPIALGILAPVDHDQVLSSGERLQPDEYLENGNCIFKMQSDCNLVLYDNGSPKWESQTASKGTNCKLLMQSDGNLVVYNEDGTALWATNTGYSTDDSFFCILKNNCNVVIDGGGRSEITVTS